MSKTEFQEYICRPFCDFYKPGVKEELLCRGALLLERLVRQGRLNPQEFHSLLQDIPLPPVTAATLEAVVCAACPFQAEDCDFRAPHPPEDARPCGGLLLLGGLLRSGWIALKDLEEAKD
ncbi:MAG: hypothetical protein MUF69_03800 [Desulfobacterota bacterium]|jgi:hypothetical protein|nr:hypothetical protein [Thermodesulfobacteriota bacterium]